MRRCLAMLLLVVPVAATGCFRTQYVNLYPPGHQPTPDARGTVDVSAWQGFWIFGWFQGRMDIDSRSICGEDNVREIHTRKTFLQGLVTVLSTVYINIYSPWDGKTICADAPPTS